MADDEEKQLRLELLAADLKLRRKQEFWETPRNIAILVGVAMAIAAAIGFWLGRWLTPQGPAVTPILSGGGDPVTHGEFMDAVQTAGIVVIASMLIYVVVRLERVITTAARDFKGAIGEQQAIGQAVNRTWARLESIEQRIEERNAILPTAKLGLTLDEIRDRLDRLEGGQ
jgi:hypothetical protein